MYYDGMQYSVNPTMFQMRFGGWGVDGGGREEHEKEATFTDAPDQCRHKKLPVRRTRRPTIVHDYDHDTFPVTICIALSTLLLRKHGRR